MGNITLLEIAATVFFGLAILHTFAAPWLHRVSLTTRGTTLKANILELLGELEAVFGIWATILVLFIALVYGTEDAVRFVNRTDFTEPAFVFVIMCVAATRPMISAAREMITLAARLLPIKGESAFLLSALTLGAWLGSLITEPAAMTLTALVLKDRFFDRSISKPLKYAILGVLFVNISIGGTLTHFAAPPVVMVATKWNWDSAFMFGAFGWKALIATSINAFSLIWLFKKELRSLKHSHDTREEQREAKVPLWLVAVHGAFLSFIVLTSHHPKMFMGIFLLFLGVAHTTREYQSRIQIREGLMVGFFLGGLVILGGPQKWWLEQIITNLGQGALFLGATSLTAVTDNAALTFLGAQVPGLPAGLKYALVAGAVAGGGLTVIANAPNPAGYGILNRSFQPHGITPLGLLCGAIPPTIIALLCFWFLPHLI